MTFPLRAVQAWIPYLALPLLLPSASAGGITVAQIAVADLTNGYGDSPSPVYGPPSGPVNESVASTSKSTDGNYLQTYSGSAYAAAGLLKAKGTNTITCLNPLGCGPYVVPPDPNAGMPVAPGIGPSGWWNDLVTVHPGDQVASLNWVFQIDGTYSATGNATADAMLIGETCSAVEDYCHGGVPRTHKTINLPANQNGLVTINMTPWVYDQPSEFEYILWVDANAAVATNGSVMTLIGPGSSTSNFYDTARLVDVYPVDANGNPVSDGTTVTDDTGFALPFETTFTPEPAFVLPLGLALAFLFLRREVKFAK